MVVTTFMVIMQAYPTVHQVLSINRMLSGLTIKIV